MHDLHPFGLSRSHLRSSDSVLEGIYFLLEIKFSIFLLLLILITNPEELLSVGKHSEQKNTKLINNLIKYNIPFSVSCFQGTPLQLFRGSFCGQDMGKAICESWLARGVRGGNNSLLLYLFQRR